MTGGASRQEAHTDAPLPQVLIVEATAGVARRKWLEERSSAMVRSAFRTFLLSCDFDRGGVWAGVRDIFRELLPEIQEWRPDLVEKHAFELVHAVPELGRSIKPKNLTLTDVASNEEKVRSYAADRAFRIIHGLVDLLDAWKRSDSPETPWIIACDDYSTAGQMSSRFFRELIRRKREQLRLYCLIGADPGTGDEVRRAFAGPESQATTILLSNASVPASDPAGKAKQDANALEEQVGSDRSSALMYLPDLIRACIEASRLDKSVRWRYFGLGTYCSFGFYSDALRYGKGLLRLATEHIPDDKQFQWWIAFKILNAYMGVGDVDAALELAEGDCLRLVEHVEPIYRAHLFYLIAMLYARYKKPRDFKTGEQYLDLALPLIEQANISEGERHFNYVFNRNGLAMIRHFQGRRHEAMDLCRSGLAELDAHLDPDKHRLHRSVLYYNIAQVNSAIGNYEQALEYYSSAMAIDPNYSEYYNERGNLFLQLGQFQDALADYLKAIELSPPYVEVFLNLAQCYRRMGDTDAAIEAYSRAIDLEPGQGLALLGRAQAHEELANVGAAIKDYTAALANGAGGWEAFANRAVLHYSAGDLRSSLTDFDRAIELAPDQVDLYQNRAMVFTSLNRDSDAARDIETALTLNLSDEQRAVLEETLQSLQAAQEP